MKITVEEKLNISGRGTIFVKTFTDKEINYINSTFKNKEEILFVYKNTEYKCIITGVECFRQNENINARMGINVSIKEEYSKEEK